MKNFLILSAVCIGLLSACNNVFTPNNDDADTLTKENRPQAQTEPRNTINRSMNGVNNNTQNNFNGTNPNALEENTKISYNGKIYMLNTIEGEVKEQLERENKGMNFKVIIEAEDDNTQ